MLRNGIYVSEYLSGGTGDDWHRTISALLSWFGIHTQTNMKTRLCNNHNKQQTECFEGECNVLLPFIAID